MPSLADRARSFLAANASRVPLIGAAAASVFSAAAPYSGEPQPPARTPPANYTVDQPQVIGEPEFRTGYHDRTYTNFSAPQWFGGRTIEIARGDIELHDSGTSFLGSSILAVASTRFAPVMVALGVRCAPAIALPRQVDGGARGLARIARDEIEAQLCPRAGLLPSPCFPSSLWGAIQIDLALMGFAVLQHVYGPPDARGVRKVYTRRWPTWAVYYAAYRRTYIALTTDGPVDILNDGKFTLIGKTDTPHLQGAIRALMLPCLDGVQVVQARAQWIDRFSDPKFLATLPPDIAAKSDIGLALQAALRVIRGPGGFGVLPHGTTFKAVGLEAKASTCFKDALESDNAYISAIMTGVDTTADAGVYKPLVFWGILRSTVGDDLAATNRGVNQGHVHPYLQFNYAAGMDEARERGQWADPVLSTPLPDPEKDARIKSEMERDKDLLDRIKQRAEVGVATTQDDANAMADARDVPRVVLLNRKPKISVTDTDRAKVYRAREIRAGDGYEPIGDERDDLLVAELDAVAKGKVSEPGEGGTVAPADGGLTAPSALAMRSNTAALLSALDAALTRTA